MKFKSAVESSSWRPLRLGGLAVNQSVGGLAVNRKVTHQKSPGTALGFLCRTAIAIG